jgi:peptidoglycan/xylan/chitin deacetylase (PgdA/CDA1 family)
MRRLLSDELFEASPPLAEIPMIKTLDEIQEPKMMFATATTETKIVAKVDVETPVKAEPQSKTIPILMYHHIRDFNEPTDAIGTNLSVGLADFTAQMDYIKSRGYNTATFADIQNGTLPEKPVILSFDDGYENFYQSAYPILKERGMKSVSYIITGKMGGDYMTETQIKELSDGGFEIGAHTISHPDLSTATTARAAKEITESKATLEAIIGKKVISFCYPSGKYSQAVEDEVRNAGYLYATTTIGGIANIAGDSYALSRYRVNNGTNINKFFE